MGSWCSKAKPAQRPQKRRRRPIPSLRASHRHWAGAVGSATNAALGARGLAGAGANAPTAFSCAAAPHPPATGRRSPCPAPGLGRSGQPSHGRESDRSSTSHTSAPASRHSCLTLFLVLASDILVAYNGLFRGSERDGGRLTHLLIFSSSPSGQHRCRPGAKFSYSALFYMSLFCIRDICV